jgi:hypothetical protein
MKKNEQGSMKVESERIRDGNRQDICEMVRNNREFADCPLQEDLIELMNNVRRASFTVFIALISIISIR